MAIIRLFIITTLCSVTLCSCSFFSNIVYRPDINQGNYITAKELDKLSIGMTKEQVAFLMGTPMLSSTYDNETWYYVFRELPTHESLRQQLYTLTFAGDKLTHIDHSSIGQASLSQMDQP